jgi:REP element-mobilizing transposase RayT
MQLSGVFAIDVAAYAVMSNHYHIVVRVDRDQALSWSQEEVLERWLRLFSGPVLINRYLSQRASLTEAEISEVGALIEEYRKRLFDVSWFMRVLNETIARKANREDGVSGRFWEGRFKSQALLDEQALLSVMAYVDLNPVRAAMAETPEDSDFTSIHERLSGFSAVECLQGKSPAPVPDQTEHPEADVLHQEWRLSILPRQSLLAFCDGSSAGQGVIPFASKDYLSLVDSLGRIVHPRKRGRIPDEQPPILERLGLTLPEFVDGSDQRFGTPMRVQQAA